jgi:SAM-dependent methyltransferase
LNELLDPVAAYDRVAPQFARLSDERRAYLDAIERLVVSGIPPGSRSLLDVGAGDGTRAGRIARVRGIEQVVLVEPSAAMRSQCPPKATVWALRAEELGSREGSFDVITCLWNVIGHIFPVDARVEALRQFRRLLSPPGRIFLDVNHRYNACQYGFGATAGRFLHDVVVPGEVHGDVTVAWDVGGARCATSGHVFTEREFRALACAAGLCVEKRFVVDYACGERRRWSYEGNLMFVLRRTPGAG